MPMCSGRAFNDFDGLVIPFNDEALPHASAKWTGKLDSVCMFIVR
jgi:hypothetical protein